MISILLPFRRRKSCIRS